MVRFNKVNIPLGIFLDVSPWEQLRGWSVTTL